MLNTVMVFASLLWILDWCLEKWQNFDEDVRYCCGSRERGRKFVMQTYIVDIACIKHKRTRHTTQHKINMHDITNSQEETVVFSRLVFSFYCYLPKKVDYHVCYMYAGSYLAQYDGVLFCKCYGGSGDDYDKR